MIILEENYKNNNIKNSQYNNSLSKKLKKFFTYTKNKHIIHNKLFRKINFKNKLIYSSFLFYSYLFLTALSSQLCFSKKIGHRQLNYNNYIVITVVRAEWHRIISGEANNNILPNKIKINDDNEKTSGIGRDYELTKETNTIKMTWNSPLTSVRNMFKKVAHIISIDLSNFDFSSITDMGSFFEECWQVQSINMSNGNAENVEI